MDLDRRKLIKLLPAAVICGAVVVNGKDVDALEVNMNKRYVFKVHGNLDHVDIRECQRVLKERGFSNCLVVTDSVEIYELV